MDMTLYLKSLGKKGFTPFATCRMCDMLADFSAYKSDAPLRFPKYRRSIILSIFWLRN